MYRSNNQFKMSFYCLAVGYGQVMVRSEEADFTTFTNTVGADLRLDSINSIIRNPPGLAPLAGPRAPSPSQDEGREVGGGRGKDMSRRLIFSQ